MLDGDELFAVVGKLGSCMLVAPTTFPSAVDPLSGKKWLIFCGISRSTMSSEPSFRESRSTNEHGVSEKNSEGFLSVSCVTYGSITSGSADVEKDLSSPDSMASDIWLLVLLQVGCANDACVEKLNIGSFQASLDKSVTPSDDKALNSSNVSAADSSRIRFTALWTSNTRSCRMCRSVNKSTVICSLTKSLNRTITSRPSPQSDR
mmetsp:Transcript_71759/g.112248  ORF Transcript_71759/g.112248 Transcript_71759/m.112248 type:complete len:205 (+) Transcript_71759:217-831(+)